MNLLKRISIVCLLALLSSFAPAQTPKTGAGICYAISCGASLTQSTSVPCGACVQASTQLTQHVSTGVVYVCVLNQWQTLAGVQSVCGGGVPTNPAPTLTSISPNVVNAGAANFTLMLTGTGFVTGSVVRFNGADKVTTLINSTTLSVAVAPSDVATVGTIAVTVFNPTPGGGLTGTQSLTVSAPQATPTIIALSPGTAVAGIPAFTLGVTGTNFTALSVVRWAGAARTTTFQSPTLLTANILIGDVAAAGTFAVTVANGASISNTSNFVVGNAFYASTSGSGSACTIGSPCSLATLNGLTSPLQPGDTGVLRGGTYTSSLNTTNTERAGFGIQVSGTMNSPITFTNYPGETAIIDGGIEIGMYPFNDVGQVHNPAWGNYIFLVASEPGRFRIISSAARVVNQPRPDGIRVWGDGFSARNIVIKDAGNAVFITGFADKVELYGLFAQNNGWQADASQPATIPCRPGSSFNCATNYRPEGNGQVYCHGDGTKVINSMIFDNYGAGAKMYAENAANSNRNQLFEKVFVYNNGKGTGALATSNSKLEAIIMGWSDGQMQNNVMRQIMAFNPRQSPGTVMRHGYSTQTNIGSVVEDSVFMGGTTQAVYIQNYNGMAFRRNIVTGKEGLIFASGNYYPGGAVSIGSATFNAGNPLDWNNNKYVSYSDTPGFNTAFVDGLEFENRALDQTVFGTRISWRARTLEHGHSYDLNSTFNVIPAATVNAFANQYNTGYGHVGVAIYDGASTFTLNLAGIVPNGGTYNIYRADQWLTGGSAVATGTYGGSGTLTITAAGVHVADGFTTYVITP